MTRTPKDGFSKIEDEFLAEFPDPICYSCRHFWSGNKCRAFSNSHIPMEIISGQIDHTLPHPSQENDLVFAPRLVDGEVVPYTIINAEPILPVVANIPHSSSFVLEDLKRNFKISDQELKDELLKLTDWYTDQIFAPIFEQGGTALIFELSRFVLDPERFEDDSKESMSKRGMGVIYTKTTELKSLRKEPSNAEREKLLGAFYRPYHLALEEACAKAIAKFGRCILIDCHSFPEKALPYELDQTSLRPDICLGTDSIHTPSSVIDLVRSICAQHNFSFACDTPFSGTVTPTKFYGDKRVISFMIEINRRLYMDEGTGEPSAELPRVVNLIDRILTKLLSLPR